MKNEESKMVDVIDEWMEQSQIRSMEGCSGVKNLEKLCGEIGYNKGAFLSASPIFNFLADNSGAIEAIIEFIRDAGIDEWKDELESYLDEKENDEE